MTHRDARIVVNLSVALSLTLLGCAAAVDDPTVAEVSAAIATTAPSPLPRPAPTTTGGTGTPRLPPDPCRTAVGVPLPPVYALRVPDSDGSIVYFGSAFYPNGSPTYDDGYTIPFPTPWVMPSATDAIAAYEAGLFKIPSVVSHEFLVHNVVLSGSEIKLEESHDYFLVGLQDPSSYAAATALVASDPRFTQKPVEAKILRCVHVVDRDPAHPTLVLQTGIYFPVGDEHDPMTNPWFH